MTAHFHCTALYALNSALQILPSTAQSMLQKIAQTIIPNAMSSHSAVYHLVYSQPHVRALHEYNIHLHWEPLGVSQSCLTRGPVWSNHRADCTDGMGFSCTLKHWQQICTEIDG